MNVKFILLSTITAIGLAACSNTPKNAESNAQASSEQTNSTQAQSVAQENQPQNLERIISVAYTCSAGQQKQPIIVKYGVIGNDLVVAQISANGQNTPVLIRNPNAINSDTENNFAAEGFQWTTDVADAKNVTTVNGNMLMRNNEILLKICTLDKKTTATLK